MEGKLNLKTMTMASMASLVVLMSFTWATPSPTPPMCYNPNQTWLHVDGIYIKNACQQKIFLRGTAFGDLAWRTEWQGDIVDRFNKLMTLTNGKVNVIRVAISPNPQFQDGSEPQTWAPGNIHPEVFDDDVDELLATAAQRKVYLIIEFHGGMDESELSRIGRDPTDFINWHLHFVNRYKDKPTVTGFELYNEPYGPMFGDGNDDLGDQRFRDMMIVTAQAITRANPKALIFVSSGMAPGYYSQVNQYWIDHPIPGNVVYTWDYYYMNWPVDLKEPYYNGDWSAAYSGSYRNIDDSIGRALRANLPVLESEVGWHGDSAPPYPQLRSEPAWEHNMNDYLSIINKMETHWLVWWWWDNPGNLGLANDGYNTLSPQGEIWVKYL